MANLLPLLLAYIVYGWSPTYFLNGPLWKIHFLSIIPKVSEHWVILYYLRFWQFLSLQTCIHNFSGQIYVHLVLHRNSVRNRISIWKKIHGNWRLYLNFIFLKLWLISRNFILSILSEKRKANHYYRCKSVVCWVPYTHETFCFVRYVIQGAFVIR